MFKNRSVEFVPGKCSIYGLELFIQYLKHFLTIRIADNKTCILDGLDELTSNNKDLKDLFKGKLYKSCSFLVVKYFLNILTYNGVLMY